MARKRSLKLYGRVFKASIVSTALGEIASWENDGQSEALDSAEYDFILGVVKFTFTNSGKTYQVPSSPYEWLDFLRAGSKGAFVNQHWLN